MNINGAGFHKYRGWPGGDDQFVARANLPLFAQQEHQQLELKWGEVDFFIGASDAMRRAIDLDFSKPEWPRTSKTLVGNDALNWRQA
ncbi:hypothetical protein N185_17400 [Sinorhizobium sp. GW3]|nr:hypothetical protein N185_17400 [Sinorhizobium sp. GW3]